MEEFNVKSIDALIEGIKHLSQSRCSFSEEEKVLLKECIHVLKKLKQLLHRRKALHLATAIKVVELLLKVFVIGEHLRDIH
jgi:hypothetical protein